MLSYGAKQTIDSYRQKTTGAKMTKKHANIIRRFAKVMLAKQVTPEYISDFVQTKLFPQYKGKVSAELIQLLAACDGIVESVPQV